MGLRSRITNSLKTAMREKDTVRIGTLRLINAAIKDQDIAARTGDTQDGIDDNAILGILGKMIKQRHDSIRAYEEGGRLELAETERAEITVIEEFLPRQLNEAEVEAAITQAITETEATGLRDMGKVMAHLKAKYTGQMDFGASGPLVKTRLM